MSFSQIISDALKAVTAVAGVQVKYARGNEFVTLCATPGHTDFSMTADDVTLEYRSRDYTFTACELKLNDQVITPQRGDTITEVVGNKLHIHEVSEPGGGDQPWRWSDIGRTHIRIHTKQQQITDRGSQWQS